jgi:uncharacterized RDD family membrane protein YckC
MTHDPMPPVRDGDRADVGRRMTAWLIDFAVTLTVAGFIVGSAASMVFDSLRSTGEDIGLSLFWHLLISGGGDVRGTAEGVLRHQLDKIVFLLVLGLLLAAFAQFLYQFVSLAWRGRTPGKALLDLQVRQSGQCLPTRAQVLRRAVMTTASELGVFSIACSLLVTGEVMLSTMVWLLATAVFWANNLPVLLPKRRSLADLVAGTLVVRTRMLQTVGRNAVDAAAVSGQLLKDSAQSALESDRGRQVAAFGSEGLARSRKAAESLARSEAAQRALQAGQGSKDKAKRLWAERKARRSVPVQPPPYPQPYPPQTSPYNQPPNPYPPQPGPYGQPPNPYPPQQGPYGQPGTYEPPQ